MPAEQTSLQEALARIMGAPAGGAPQSPPTADEAAPRTPYSEDLANFMPTTDVSLSSAGAYDPFAKQNAELEAMKAQTTALQADLQRQIANPPSYPPLPAPWTPPVQQAAPAPVYTVFRPPPPPPPQYTPFVTGGQQPGNQTHVQGWQTGQRGPTGTP